jgi:choline dehydrogenase-like flavoprotein
MLRDLKVESPSEARLTADVIVVGAGVAGLTLASKLAKEGLRAIVFESGGRSQQSETHPLNEVVLEGDSYRGAQRGRARCLGGTSTLWGGAMLPMMACDLGQHTAGWDVDWPVSLAQLEPHFDEIERTFRLPSGNFGLPAMDEADPVASGFQFCSAKWPTFSRRNLARLLASELDSPNPDVWMNATVTRFNLDEGGRLRSVEAESGSGSSITASAPLFALAAGTIESTRSLLLLNAQHGKRVFPKDGPLGRRFHDHLSAMAARIEPTDRIRLNETFGLRFQRDAMRDVRLVPREELRRARRLPGGFAHLAATSNGSDGFTALRTIQRSIQRGAIPQLSDFCMLARDAGWLMRAAWWFAVKRCLLAASGASSQLYLVIEQEPHLDNRITLSADRRDIFGVPLAKLDWKVRDADLQSFGALQGALHEYWNASGLSTLGVFERTPRDEWAASLRHGGDIYHPGGTTRMGADRLTGVVDADLLVHGVPNLYVVSTSAFPSGGSSNPTFLLMAFALRAARHMAAALRSKIVSTGCAVGAR